MPCSSSKAEVGMTSEGDEPDCKNTSTTEPGTKFPTLSISKWMGKKGEPVSADFPVETMRPFKFLVLKTCPPSAVLKLAAVNEASFGKYLCEISARSKSLLFLEM